GRQIVSAAGFVAWDVKGGDGVDTFNLNDQAAITSIEVNIDGGGPANTLNYNSDDRVSYVPGTTGTSGSFRLPFFTPFYDVNFSGITVANVNLVADTVGFVEAGAGANQITVTATAPTNARVTVDNGTQVTFTGLTAFVVNGNGGDDAISISPSGATFGTTINGGDPAAIDSLTVNGTLGVDTISYNPSTAIGSGSVKVNA